MSEHGFRISASWLGFIVTILTQIIAFTYFLAKMQSGLIELRTEVARINVIHEQGMTEVRRLEFQVQYLCNERRRDNQEAGVSNSSVCEGL